jgi:rifampin ADP-ribosylating transferase
VVGEIAEWEAYDAEFVRQLREFVASGSGEIIN